MPAKVSARTSKSVVELTLQPVPGQRLHWVPPATSNSPPPCERAGNSSDATRPLSSQRVSPRGSRRGRRRSQLKGAHVSLRFAFGTGPEHQAGVAGFGEEV